jgi:hypothetical protein
MPTYFLHIYLICKQFYALLCREKQKMKLYIISDWANIGNYKIEAGDTDEDKAKIR